MSDTATASVFGLPIGHAAAWIFNCYVIGGEGDDLVVVDPGLPVVARSMLELMARDLGRGPEDIADIMCTHAHPDHVGGVSHLLGAADTPGVHLPWRCRSYLDGEVPRVFPLVESSLRFMPVYVEQPFSRRALVDFGRLSRKVGFSGLGPMTLDFEPTGYLDTGDALATAPGWEAIHTPGHTDDSTCLYHRDSATLISGDAVVTQGGVAWFNPEWVDQAASQVTEERLRALEVRHLLPGHGRPIEATDVWRTARSSTERPTGPGLLARCSRRLGRW